MAHLIRVTEDGEVRCSECDMVFIVIWYRNPVYDRIEYCPFCGDEIERSVVENE